MNSLLQQQIEQALGKDVVVPEGVSKLLHLISETYDQYTRDPGRSHDPKEIFAMYLKLTKEIELYKKLIDEMSSDLTIRKEAEEKLEQRNKELTFINAELDGFVYNASHELRAPLASLLGLISVARAGESNAEKLRLFELMKTSVDKLNFFIMDLVNFAKNSRLEIESEKIDFRQLIDDCIAHLRYMAGRERIRIDIDVQAGDDFCSDKKRISVVLNNLVSNAIKYYNPQAEAPFVSIRVVQTAEQATVEISDNGIGIPKTHIDKVFQMFVRATEKQSGSGIGLYIVHEIIEKMKGGVSVHSQEGKGSTFSFHIPNLCHQNSL